MSAIVVDNQTEVARERQRSVSIEGAVEPGVAQRSLLYRVAPHAAVLMALFAMAVVATWPLFPNLGGYVIDKNNPLYSVWLMAWQAHALVTDPMGIFNTTIMYPIEGTLAFDELAFTEAVLAAPLYWLTGNPVLSHNALLFSTFILAGYGGWLLVRELTGSAWAAFVGATALGFSFYMFNHLPHQTLINAQWIPFILLSAYKLLWTHSWRWAAAMSAFFALQALSGHYLAFYTGLLLGSFFVYYFLVQRRLFSWGLVGKVASSLLVAMLVILPIALPYASIQSGYGFKRNLFEVERFSNTLASFLAVFRGSPVYQRLLAPFADPGPWAVDRAAFPGFATLLLAVAAVPLSVRYSRKLRRDESPAVVNHGPSALGKHAVFFGLVALLSAFLSLGPSLQITYAPSVYDPEAIKPIMPLPYLLLHDWVPGFQSMRVVSRIGVLTTVSLAVLAGIGAFFVLRWFGRLLSGHQLSRLALPALAVMMALLPVAESWSAPIKMEPVGTRQAVPPVYRWLAVQPPTIILEYPMTHYKRGETSVVMANTYQYYSTYHWQRMINASVAIRPFAHSAVVRETEECFPCPRSLEALWALGVEYVVVHLENLSDPQREEFLWRATSPAAKVLDHFELVEEWGSDRVYRLKGPRSIEQLKALLPPGSSILLDDPANDPTLRPDELVYGGYMAALAFYLREHTQYGDSRLTFGQAIKEWDTDNRPEFALLWASTDPTVAGYRPENRVWANEFVALYKRGTGIAGVERAP